MKDNLRVHDTASGTMHIYCKWYNPLRFTNKTKEINIPLQ